MDDIAGTEPQLDRRAARLTKLFERSSEAAKIGVWECNLNGEHLTWTDVVYDIFDLPRGSRLDRSETLQFYPPAARAELERVRRRAIESEEGFTLEAPIRTAKGVDKWIRITATVEREHGAPTRIFGLKQDITTEKNLAEQTRYLAEYDPLTHLANRGLFRKSLDALARASHSTGTLLLLDLDGFKQVNDRFGHSQGDASLRQLAIRLKSVCAGADLIARIGGDEFAVLLDRQVAREECKELAEQIIKSFRAPVVSGSESFELGVSIGIARLGSGPDESTAASMFTDADLALYAAKSAGKNTFSFFEHRFRDKANHRLRMIATIETALIRSELALYYQPKVRLTDGALVGFEALLRYRLPSGQMVGPGDFKCAMDDPALSLRIGSWVLKEAIGQAALWRDAGLAYGCLSINISQAQLNQPDFAQTLLDEIASRGLPPDSIEIEITEGVFLDDEANATLEQLSFIRSKGVRIAMDDFGTGYASLVHLRNFPIDVIKVDRSFVRDVLASPSDAAILECAISLASRLGKMLVVEGVEAADQLAYLQGVRCEFAQGDFFSHAVPANRAGELMKFESCGSDPKSLLFDGVTQSADATEMRRGITGQANAAVALV
jgi:diguanylate cyclase (GGDEF)-like protein